MLLSPHMKSSCILIYHMLQQNNAWPFSGGGGSRNAPPPQYCITAHGNAMLYWSPLLWMCLLTKVSWLKHVSSSEIGLYTSLLFIIVGTLHGLFIEPQFRSILTKGFQIQSAVERCGLIRYYSTVHDGWWHLKWCRITLTCAGHNDKIGNYQWNRC